MEITNDEILMLGYYFPSTHKLCQIFEILRLGLLNIVTDLKNNDFVQNEKIHLCLCMSRIPQSLDFEVYKKLESVIKEHNQFPMTLRLQALERIGPKLVCVIRRDENFKQLFNLFCQLEEVILQNDCEYLSNYVHGKFYITLMCGQRYIELDDGLISAINSSCISNHDLTIEIPSIMFYKPFNPKSMNLSIRPPAIFWK